MIKCSCAQAYLPTKKTQKDKKTRLSCPKIHRRRSPRFKAPLSPWPPAPYRLMLPKSHRLSRPDLLSLRRSGRRYNLPYAGLIYQSNALGHLRLAVEISTAIDKRSVYRNRLRRQIISLLEKPPYRLQSLDLLIIVKPTTLDHLSDLLPTIFSSL